MTTEITTLDDLSFVVRDDDLLVHWQPQRGQHSPEAGMAYGRECVLRELAQLACVDEHDAYTAITHALASRAWNGGCAEEVGMADGLARLAVIGLRDDGEGRDAVWHHVRSEACGVVFVAPARGYLRGALKALKVKPWRTYRQAGLD